MRGENPLRTARRTGRANRVHILDPQGLSPVFPTLQAVQGLGQSRWDWVADRGSSADAFDDPHAGM